MTTVTTLTTMSTTPRYVLAGSGSTVGATVTLDGFAKSRNYGRSKSSISFWMSGRARFPRHSVGEPGSAYKCFRKGNADDSRADQTRDSRCKHEWKFFMAFKHWRQHTAILARL